MRRLTTIEIAALEQRGCLADCWAQVLVADTFRPEQLTRVQFRSHALPQVAAVLDETGSRSVVLSPYLTSPLAALIALSVDEVVRERLNTMLAASMPGSCYIGTNAVVSDSLLIDSVVLADAHVQDGVMLERSLVGEACHVEKQFSAVDSLFFANCQMAHGEACSVFAGPYTVSHHKSTLLIGGMYSFYNAGSNTNYSNHAYKRGPVHWGVMERGAKTASGAHVIWPARIGAFTMVMGKHAGHPDTTLFPFSYLIADGTKSYLVPGVNLATYGTWRDSEKWPKRDGRKTQKNDTVSFDIYSDYVLGQMQQGLTVLRELATEDKDEYLWNGLSMRRSAVLRGIRYYEILLAAATKPLREMVDLGGEWVEKSCLAQVLQAIRDGQLTNLVDVNEMLIHSQAEKNEFTLPAEIMTLVEEDKAKEEKLIDTWKGNLLY